MKEREGDRDSERERMNESERERKRENCQDSISFGFHNPKNSTIFGSCIYEEITYYIENKLRSNLIYLKV